MALDQRFLRNGVVGPLTGESRGPVDVRAIGYASVAVEEPGDGCAGEFQRQAERIASECAQRGLLLVTLLREREPRHQWALERPSLGYALGGIAAGEASGLVVSDLSRLAHSVRELGRVLEWFAGHDARLVAGTQASTPARKAADSSCERLSKWGAGRVSGSPSERASECRPRDVKDHAKSATFLR